jgi:hypothetical protein
MPDQLNEPTTIRVFISYRHQDEAHNAWVERLYRDLRSQGVDALLDKYEVALGESFSEYMVKGVRDSRHVLFIITSASVEKVESDSSGPLGFELQIANARRLAQNSNFSIIGIFREGEATPTYLSDHRYIDFRNDLEYEVKLEELLQWLHGEIKPPPIGKRRADPTAQVEIHIRAHYRTRFQLSLVSQGAIHWAINRLFCDIFQSLIGNLSLLYLKPLCLL